MKRILKMTLAMMAAAAMMAAQTGAQPSQPAAPSPGAPTQGAAAQTVPAAAPQGGRPQPQAKTQDEYKAFLDANSKTGGVAVTEAAANDFATKFPQSDLRALLYMKAMREYQNADNADKTIEMGHKALALDPNNPEALVTVASVLSERTRETDLDRDERLGEATRNANKALETVSTDLVIPASIPADKVEQVKNVLRSMAYSALGTVELAKKNYSGAEGYLRKSTELNQINPDPITWLRLSVTLDQQKKYPDALVAANKAIEYSGDMPQANNLAKMERDRLMKLSAGPAGGTASPQAAPTAPSTSPSTAPSTMPSPAPKPTTPPPGTPKG